MRILVLHNRYRPVAPSGENAVVDQESTALAAAGHQVRVLQRHSGDIDSWSRLRRISLPAQVIWSEQSRRMLARELRDFAPDVVHVHNTFPLLSASVLHACAAAAVPLVATVHNYKLGCANGELFRDGAVCHDCLGGSTLPAVRHGCYRSSRLATLPVVAATSIHARAWRRLVSAYLFISAAQRDRLLPMGFAPERSFVKYNFVPPPPISATASAAASGGERGQTEPVVAYVGRLDAAKGAPLLMASWDALRRERPRSSLRLVIAGGGPMAEEVGRWALAHPSVTVAGLVPREQAATILAGARAAVVPSVWEETFGLVAVEAMAAGTAPIASAHGAFPELITPGRDGALFPPGDARALTEALLEVERAPARWAGYGRRARRTYQRRFTEQAGVERLIEIYRFARAHPIGWSAPAGVSGEHPPALLPR